MHGRVAHHALFEMCSPRFELRLDQRYECGWSGNEPIERRQDQLERDEAHIDRGEVWRLRQKRRIERTDIGLLQRNDLMAFAQARMKLAVPNINRVDAPRA